MNYREELERCIEYIELNLDENISVESLADYMGYSFFHFIRVFQCIVGIPPMEYVRQRRLSRAAIQIAKGNKILDTALEFGYDTPSGFSKAFRKEFGYSPRESKKRIFQIDLPKIIKKPSLLVAGYEVGLSKNTDMKAFWEYYTGESLEERLYRILNPLKHGELGIWIPKQQNVQYILGVMVEDFTKTTIDMEKIIVPNALYAVFTTPPVDTTKDPEQKEFVQAIKSCWRYIFDIWFPISGYVYDDSAMDFEFYDERCHSRPDTVMEIWVPIK